MKYDIDYDFEFRGRRVRHPEAPGQREVAREPVRAVEWAIPAARKLPHGGWGRPHLRAGGAEPARGYARSVRVVNYQVPHQAVPTRGGFFIPIGDGTMETRKPKAVADDPYKSAKWDELTAGRSLGRSDAPALSPTVRAMQRALNEGRF